jgi:hypothetical protein
MVEHTPATVVLVNRSCGWACLPAVPHPSGPLWSPTYRTQNVSHQDVWALALLLQQLQQRLGHGQAVIT